MKKLLFLGAAPTQLPPIQYALEAGYYVITCDYKPDNPGHALANEWHNISTTDKEKVLALARRLEIDGIIAYASDVAAPTAAYVSEALGLPGHPFAGTQVLTRKDKFRIFLEKQGYRVPRSRSFYSLNEAQAWARELRPPLFIKPVDSAGNKGISIIETPSELAAAFDYALEYSLEGKVVVEERIAQVGYQIDSDVFLVEGKLAFWLWADAHFDPLCSPPFPTANSYPSVLDPRIGQRAADQLEAILDTLGFRTGAFNVEFLVDAQGEVWFLEVGPRNGGDCIPDTLQHVTGVDLIKATVEAALGLDCSWVKGVQPLGCWSNYVVHAMESGTFESLQITDELHKRLVSKQIWVNPGDLVEVAKGSNHTLGVLILRFRDQQEMLHMLDNMHDYLQVRVTPAQRNTTLPPLAFNR